jgi:pilus assembly protein CpaF
VTSDALVDQVRDRLARSPGDLTPHRVAEALRESGRPVGDATVLAVYESLRRDVVGAGPLEPLLRLPGVTDVLVNGPGQVFVDRGSGLEPSGVTFPDDEAVRRLAQRLASFGGRRLDEAVPHVDLRLPDGTRLHAVLAPVARPGTLISLRVPPTSVFTLDGLVEAGTVGPEGADLLRRLVAARVAFLVSGGTPPPGKPLRPRPYIRQTRHRAGADPMAVDRLHVRHWGVASQIVVAGSALAPTAASPPP